MHKSSNTTISKHFSHSVAVAQTLCNIFAVKHVAHVCSSWKSQHEHIIKHFVTANVFPAAPHLLWVRVLPEVEPARRNVEILVDFLQPYITTAARLTADVVLKHINLFDTVLEFHCVAHFRGNEHYW